MHMQVAAIVQPLSDVTQLLVPSEPDSVALAFTSLHSAHPTLQVAMLEVLISDLSPEFPSPQLLPLSVLLLCLRRARCLNPTPWLLRSQLDRARIEMPPKYRTFHRSVLKKQRGRSFMTSASWPGTATSESKV